MATSAKWDIHVGEPKFAVPELASLQTLSPRNTHAPDTIGIFVSLWCGRDHIDLAETGVDWLSYGFRIGEIQIEVRNGDISHEGRFKQEFFRQKVDQNAKDTSAKEGKLGGALGFDFGKLFGNTKLAAEMAGKFSTGSIVFEEKRGEYFRVVWRVADAGHNVWRFDGVGLNADGVLENKIIGDEPLFFVMPDSDADQVHITVKYFGDLFGLWVDDASAGTSLKGADGIAKRKEVVISSIMAKALKKASEHNKRRLVLLCQQRLTAKKISEAL
jgi:hypothetical protein